MSKIYFYREKNFKKTEIGEIPREWEVKKIKDVFKVLTGTTPSTKNPAYWENGNINWFTPEDLSNQKIFVETSKRKITKQALKEYKLNLLQRGDILISTRAPVGYVSVVKTEGAFNQGCKGLTPREEVETLFFAYFLRFNKNLLNNLAGGSTFKELPKKILENFKVPYPTKLKEQKNIAKVLKDFDDLLENIEKQIKTLERVKKGLMNIYFTKGVFKHETFKDTEIGRIPAEWEVRRLGEVAKDIYSGGTPSTKIKAFWDGHIPWTTSVLLGTMFLTKGLRNITEKGLRFSSTKLVPAENILIANRVGVGKVSINKVDIAISQDITALILDKKKINLEYAYWSIKFFIRKLISKITRGTTIKGITKKDIKNFLIPLPPLEEQKAIAERLKTIDDQIENLKKQKKHLQKVKKKFMDLLLMGKIRIKTQ